MHAEKEEGQFQFLFKSILISMVRNDLLRTDGHFIHKPKYFFQQSSLYIYYKILS